MQRRSGADDNRLCIGSPRMGLSAEDIQRLAHLARIDVDANAIRDVQAKLDAILGLIDELQAIDTTGVAPMAQIGRAHV